MHTVKHAIIMAAGKGERLNPVTLDTPKPLVKVNGVRMIDTSIDALHANGINDIYIVTGYMMEEFSVLLEKYPDLHLIPNHYYTEYNNISSLYVAKDVLDLGDLMILDGDLVISNPDIFRPEFERSGYNTIWTEEKTDEWLMQIDDSGTVTSCSRTGGNKGWILLGISRWTAEDAAKLKKYLEYEFDQAENRHLYWDDIVMFQHFDRFSLGYREMKRSDVVEIDSYEELVAADPTYRDYKPHTV
ncbi:CTP:phosphocholine cytidylyltransferase [Lachnospiraceae bacterium NE2001]|nr:CTP:phosphocholine cytidylyltransferase [Lachnospiraceae bacterium NE2001]